MASLTLKARIPRFLRCAFPWIYLPGTLYRIPHQKRHNDIPISPVARARLRALIDQTRSDLRACSKTITRSQISRVLELQESLFAPIQTLPSDVLTEIVQLAIETSRDLVLPTNPGSLSSFLGVSFYSPGSASGGETRVFHTLLSGPR
ncbi:hypothetical protein BDP27DRAFT_922318 [Rhodocollybia butyracea]|uniref:Uncharacterized protein n=1 Tax=Rhodocollybia butyracea TaxID=206335 RepID=A0A9P5PSQ5_9AGAR|nr:hypothetical protein BDP27DRAFT_922318 [Rhodocollybia butyracea]